MMPFLWLISQDANNFYDTYDSAVVVAATEADARLIHPDSDHSWDAEKGEWYKEYPDASRRYELYSSWAPPGKVQVANVGIPAAGMIEGSVICASFNSG
jgi:hypothetical protein